MKPNQTLIKAEQSIIGTHATLTPISLTVKLGTLYPEWEKIGKTLQGIGRAMPWWVGDWIRFGETAYGEKHAQAISETGLDYQTLANYAWVCGKIEFSRRRENLSFRTHAEVARFEPEEQNKWLDKTEKEEWGSNELREEIRNKKIRDDRSEAITDLDIRKGDFKKVLADINDIDAIITDPPYPKEFIQCYSDLSEYASKHLKEKGFLAAYSGQYNLPEVINRLSEHLTYVWTFCLYHVGKKQLVNGVNIMCGWKPVVIFSRGCKKMKFSVYDVLVSEMREKESHEWQQNKDAIIPLIEVFTNPGELVVDPFCGSGSFGITANELGRRFIGAEINDTTDGICSLRQG